MTSNTLAPPALAGAGQRALEAFEAERNAVSCFIAERPRQLVFSPGEITHPFANSRYQSPLRYPGAKSSLAPTLRRLIETASASSAMGTVDLLVEPFAGGASASLRMVTDGVVERVLLADKDPLVATMWQVAASDTENLIDRLTDEWTNHVRHGGERAVSRWDYWRDRPESTDSAQGRLDAAVRCIFLNRTTFSGILHGKAGPIGGRAQASDYGIQCRWPHDNLVSRLRLVGELYSRGRLVDVWCRDWRETMDGVSESYKTLLPSRVVAYLDPPYLDKSSRLYRASFDPTLGYRSSAPSESRVDSLHLSLAEFLLTRSQFRWILSYDANPMLYTSPWLYGRDRMHPSPELRRDLGVRCWRLSKRLVRVRYSASASVGKRGADELIVTTLPADTVPEDEVLRPLIVAKGIPEQAKS